MIVNIPHNGETGNVRISINGKSIEIPRGVDYEVPDEYADVVKRYLNAKEFEKRTEQKTIVLYAEKAEEYLNNPEKGDEALAAILQGKQILVRVPNADGKSYTAVYSPVIMYQVPNYANNYLYLLHLNDGMTNGMPTYGQLKMLLSKEYNKTPLN